MGHLTRCLRQKNDKPTRPRSGLTGILKPFPWGEEATAGSRAATTGQQPWPQTHRPLRAAGGRPGESFQCPSICSRPRGGSSVRHHAGPSPQHLSAADTPGRRARSIARKPNSGRSP